MRQTIKINMIPICMACPSRLIGPKNPIQDSKAFFSVYWIVSARFLHPITSDCFECLHPVYSQQHWQGWVSGFFKILGCFQLSYVLLKCMFNGYDFILPTLGMVATPIVFYGILDKWNKDKFITRSITVILAALIAILISLIILSFQIMYVSESPQDGINYVIETSIRRTFGNDPSLLSIDENASNASLWSILKIYLSEYYFNKFHIPYFAIIIIFAIVSAIYLVSNRLRPGAPERTPKGLSLIATTWFSLLSPLSWYTIFKSLAYYHTHMNFLPWHMPFTIFGFGMCGYVIEALFRHRKHI